jgi:hypothetical protein
MPKATLTLPNGTVVQVEGTAQEVTNLLQFYEGAPGKALPRRPGKRGRARKTAKAKAPDEIVPESVPDLAKIVNLVKECAEAEAIEHSILDNSSILDRTLLPLYVVLQHLDNAHGLSSGDISKITTDLGVRVSQSHASDTLSGTAARFVIGDKVRRKGQAVRYKLSRRGLKYVQGIIGGTSSDDET